VLNYLRANYIYFDTVKEFSFVNTLAVGLKFACFYLWRYARETGEVHFSNN